MHHKNEAMMIQKENNRRLKEIIFGKESKNDNNSREARRNKGPAKPPTVKGHGMKLGIDQPQKK
jgi:hypothetical protein